MNYIEFDNIIRNTKELFNKNNTFDVEEKSRDNFVTTLDKIIESYLVTNLSSLVPNASFVLEEGNKDFSDIYFVIDPLDGTYNYMRGIKCYGISVALIDSNNIIYSSLYDPNEDILLSSYNSKVYLNENEYTYTNKKNSLDKSLVDLGTSPYIKSDSTKIASLLNKLLPSLVDIRRSGSTVINLINIALGKLDGFIEPNLSIWDYIGGVGILNNLGLYSSNFQGEKIDLRKLKDNFVASSNKELHEELLKIIGDVYA